MPYADEEEEEEAADESDSDDDLPLGVAAKLPSDKALVKQVRLYFVSHDCHCAEAGLITKQYVWWCPISLVLLPFCRRQARDTMRRRAAPARGTCRFHNWNAGADWAVNRHRAPVGLPVVCLDMAMLASCARPTGLLCMQKSVVWVIRQSSLVPPARRCSPSCRQ